MFEAYLDRLTMLLKGPSRGDVIVLDSPTTPDELLIKRVIGLPNENVVIRDGRVYINGRRLDESYVKEYCTYLSCNGEWQLGPDEYFVLGDNRSHSLDSHEFGPVPASSIKGIARVRYWPPDQATCSRTGLPNELHPEIAQGVKSLVFGSLTPALA
jgi:signal peptidase I